jgi:predicted transcriptional regulator
MRDKMRLLKPSEIRTQRLELGLTQAQLAKLAGVTQAYIAKIEAGTADPTMSIIEKILETLDKTASEKEKIASEKYVTAGEIMATPVISVKPDDKIERAAKLMNSYKISQLPVIDGETQVGSISEATLMHQLTAGKDMSKLVRRSIKEIMESPFPTVSKDTDVETIYYLLEHGPAVLVVDRGKAVGILTKADALKLRKLKS